MVFIALECVLRLILFTGIWQFDQVDFDKVIHKYADDPRLIYEMKPSFRIINRHNKEVKTNSYGMRDDEFVAEKPDGIYRVVIIGDSVAFGTYLEQRFTFGEILEGKLNEIRPSEVLNFSVSGYNAYQEEIILKEKISSFDPDLVIIAHCLNDDSYTDGLGALEREMSPAALGPRWHSKLLTLILHRLERGVFSRFPDRHKVERLFISLSEESKKHNYQTLVLIFPYKYKTIEHYDSLTKHYWVRRLLNKHSIVFIDFLDVWKDKSSKEREDLYMRDDKVHLSRLGMHEVGEKLFEYTLMTKIFSK